jgi:hypothetical protein
MPASGPERIMWLFILLLVAGYLGGQWLNRQRSKRIGAWLQAGLGSLGGRVAWRWLKSMSAGAEVTIQEAREPYRNLAISYYLLTREFPPLWLWEHLRGRRDLLTLRADLHLQPAREFEILPLNGALRKKLDAATTEHPYTWRELSHGLGMATQGAAEGSLVQRAGAFLKQYGAYVERISVRRRKPNVLVFMRVTGLERTKSDALWREVGELVRQPKLQKDAD